MKKLEGKFQELFPARQEVRKTGSVKVQQQGNKISIKPR